MDTQTSEHHPLDLVNLSPRGREVALAVHRVITAREALNAEWRKSLCIGAGEMVTLGHLWTEGPASMQAVAEVVGVSAPTMTAIADRLAARGWVERSTDQIDRRRVYLTASAASMAAFQPCVEPLVNGLAKAAERYSPDEVTTILSFLEDVREVEQGCMIDMREGDGE